ncbi:hypothetical protein C7B76_04260 [filamentous cyanobacterium CCP2]|nr:hypothetical protein C7B76_04260 [filamentous cyanobacterium CCP2]
MNEIGSNRKSLTYLRLLAKGIDPMTDMNRGIMKFKGADSTPAVALSGLLIIGAIVFLILWALQSAYAFS